MLPRRFDRPPAAPYSRPSPLRLAAQPAPPRPPCPRWRVAVRFAADGETDSFTWTGEAADEQLAFEAAFDAITDEYGPPDDVLDVETERLA